MTQPGKRYHDQQNFTKENMEGYDHVIFKQILVEGQIPGDIWRKSDAEDYEIRGGGHRSHLVRNESSHDEKKPAENHNKRHGICCTLRERPPTDIPRLIPQHDMREKKNRAEYETDVKEKGDNGYPWPLSHVRARKGDNPVQNRADTVP